MCDLALLLLDSSCIGSDIRLNFLQNPVGRTDYKRRGQTPRISDFKWSYRDFDKTSITFNQHWNIGAEKMELPLSVSSY